MDFTDILAIFAIIILLALIGLLIFGAVQHLTYEATKTEVETYTVGCEVSQMAYAEESVSQTRSKATYKMGVRCDDFAATFTISAEEFAMYTVGDIVEVEVIVYEYEADSKTEYEYRLVGAQN